MFVVVVLRLLLGALVGILALHPREDPQASRRALDALHIGQLADRGVHDREGLAGGEGNLDLAAVAIRERARVGVARDEAHAMHVGKRGADRPDDRGQRRHEEDPRLPFPDDGSPKDDAQEERRSPGEGDARDEKCRSHAPKDIKRGSLFPCGRDGSGIGGREMRVAGAERIT